MAADSSPHGASDAASSLSAILGHADVNKLLTDPAAETRAELAAKIGHGLGDSQLGDDAQRLALAIAWTLARDVAEAVRAALADTVRTTDALPRDLAQILAEDVDRIALPVLACASCFTEADLLSFAEHGSAARQGALADRQDVSSALAERLVTCARDREVVVRLLRNPAAAVDSRLLGRCLDSYREAGDVAGAAALHPALTPELAERLSAAAAGAFFDSLLARSGVEPDALAALIAEARRRAAQRLLGDASDPLGLDNLIELLASRARLTPGLIVRMACRGDLAFVERGLARLARIPLANVRALLYDAGTLGLKSLAEKAGLAREQFAVFYLAVTTTQGCLAERGPAEPDALASRIATRMLTKTGRLDSADRDFLVKQVHAEAA